MLNISGVGGGRRPKSCHINMPLWPNVPHTGLLFTNFPWQMVKIYHTILPWQCHPTTLNKVEN